MNERSQEHVAKLSRQVTSTVAELMKEINSEGDLPTRIAMVGLVYGALYGFGRVAEMLFDTVFGALGDDLRKQLRSEFRSKADAELGDLKRAIAK